MKRTCSVEDLKVLKIQRKIDTGINTNQFLEAIGKLRQPELEKSWETDESFTIILLDTFSLKSHKKDIAKCIAKQPYPGNLYLLRMHGGLLSYPFWTKIESQVSEEDKVEAVQKFFVDVGLKDGSPIFMTIHWVDAALRRNNAMKDATKIIVMTNSFDKPCPDTNLRMRDGTQLSYDAFTNSGRRRMVDLRNTFRAFLNLKWVFVIPGNHAYKLFSKLQREKDFFFILLHNPRFDVLSFQLSKMFDLQPFKPPLREGETVTLDRSDNEMKRLRRVFTPLDEIKTIQFLRRNNEATMIKERFFVTTDYDNDYGKYKRLVRGCIFETRAEGRVVKYALYNYARLGLKDRAVTLKRNTTQHANTNYLGRPLNTVYNVIEVDYSKAMVVVRDLNDKNKNNFPVPISKVVLQENSLLI